MSSSPVATPPSSSGTDRHFDGQKPTEITIGEFTYHLISNPENFLHGQFGYEGFTPVFVFTTDPGRTVDASSLTTFRSDVLEKDDVFQPDFYQNIVFYGCAEDDVSSDVIQLLAQWNVQTRVFINDSANGNVRPGPYVYQNGKTWQPWKVYHDYNGCFMTSLKPSPEDPTSLIAVDAPTAGLGGRVLVPSRSYFKPSASRPLDGARISVKDNIDIAGHKTSLCNLSWLDLYPVKTKHAACVQTLIDAGAVIVGKVKLQAMINREEPLECVEFTAPFNPRGDGYLVPSGSSHASAAGIGSYDWLDFSIGSDTNGSGRKPASYNGCFSIRPSTGTIDTKGVMGFFPEFDMPVFFGRDIERFTDFISAWYGQSPLLRQPQSIKTSIKLLYPKDYLPTVNDVQTRLINNFVEGVEAAFEVERTHVSLAERWANDCPDGPEHADIAKYLENAGIMPFYYEQYHNSSDFREGYQKKHGRPPFVHRALLWQWEDIGKNISKEERDYLWRRSEVYRHWLLDRIFDSGSKDSITIMVLPIEVGKPNYRDAELPPYTPLLSGYAALNMSPMSRSPEVTAPVGEIPYHSRVSRREEPLPIAVSVIGPPGTDLILADIVEKSMKAGGLATEVRTGSSMY